MPYDIWVYISKCYLAPSVICRGNVQRTSQSSKNEALVLELEKIAGYQREGFWGSWYSCAKKTQLAIRSIVGELWQESRFHLDTGQQREWFTVHSNRAAWHWGTSYPLGIRVSFFIKEHGDILHVGLPDVYSSHGSNTVASPQEVRIHWEGLPSFPSFLWPRSSGLLFHSWKISPWALHLLLMPWTWMLSSCLLFSLCLLSPVISSRTLTFALTSATAS